MIKRRNDNHVYAQADREPGDCDSHYSPSMFLLPTEGIDMGAIKISRNLQRAVCAAKDRKSLAVWTRRRQQLEWWGMYEQKEPWIFLFIFAAFVWSLLCDWRQPVSSTPPKL